MIKGEMVIMTKDLIIRSSIAEFLIFENILHRESPQVRYDNESIWLTKEIISILFDTTTNDITKHINEIYEDNELDKDSTYSKMELVQKVGNNIIKKNVEYYELSVVISISFRINSNRAIQFRRYLTSVLKLYSIRGYVLDEERLENGSYINEEYFKYLIDSLESIRLSKRNFCQKITDLYITSIDYDKSSPITIKLFNRVIDKVVNTLSTQELENEKLELVVLSLLDLAEEKTKRYIPMTMEDWSSLIEKFLFKEGRDILKDIDLIVNEIKCDKSLTEYETFKKSLL